MPSPKELFIIRPISYKWAMDIVVEHHYLHRKAPCSFAFGLFCKETDRCLGAICYGTQSSAPLRSGICRPDEKNNVIELTRLWIKDGTPTNTESYFIGNTIKLVDKEIIVSFAEIEQGHSGVIYQATNWIYTGLSAKRTNWSVDGFESHNQTMTDKYSSAQVREKYGDKFSLVDRPRKHRYLYFNAGRRRKKELLLKLRYKIEPYPKQQHAISTHNNQ